jgi:hypothetical protein
MPNPLPKKEWASYQLAFAVIKHLREEGHLKKNVLSDVQSIRKVGNVIRKYRAEERKVN